MGAPRAAGQRQSVFRADRHMSGADLRAKKLREMTSETTGDAVVSDALRLCVGDLALTLDARGSGVALSAPLRLARFVTTLNEAGAADAAAHGLVLRVGNRAPAGALERAQRVFWSEIWELWQDGAGRLIFSAPRQKPVRYAIVNGDFTSGVAASDFGDTAGAPVYPLAGIDNVIFVNWLAQSGDVMLHASGISLAGDGYVFFGHAGAGKSTLGRLLADEHGALLLGEDQIMLRYLDGAFWIYGTPWHEDPARCSPQRAPLRGVFYLDRTQPSGVRALTPARAVSHILQTAFIPYYRPTAVPAILQRLELLTQQLPVHCLSYQLGADPLPILRSA